VGNIGFSNPVEEELILDPVSQKMADKIVAGIKDFLISVAEENNISRYLRFSLLCLSIYKYFVRFNIQSYLVKLLVFEH
jgi:hypothetical protein